MAPRAESILTPVQWLVLERLSLGDSNEEIGRELGIREGTVKMHLTGIYQRLPLGGAANKRAAAVAWYRREAQEQPERRDLPPAPIREEAPRAKDRPDLTSLQWRILALVAEGHNDQAIARALLMSRLAVKHRVQAICLQLPLGDAADRRAAVVDWYQSEGHRYHEGAE